jgi:hydrogenase expression/formation protein HypE
VFEPALRNPLLAPLADAALLAPTGARRLAFSTDSSVVRPLFFPGGDIGELAVNGTVNDLAMSGARPLALSMAWVLEEGLPVDDLRRIAASAGAAARAAGVVVATGDTKVVERGRADGVYIATSGVGVVEHDLDLSAGRIRPGDRVLVSGTLGDHGMAILVARGDLELEGDLRSDTAPLHDLARSLLDECGGDVHFLRDPTRGGVSAALHEAAEAAGVTVVLDESTVPVADAVRGACELLGLDPLYVANEGKLLAIVAPGAAARALACLRRHPLGGSASMIGEISPGPVAEVLVRGPLGAVRVLDEPSGAPLPRIC